jgi:hypothetical protein
MNRPPTYVRSARPDLMLSEIQECRWMNRTERNPEATLERGCFFYLRRYNIAALSVLTESSTTIYM